MHSLPPWYAALSEFSYIFHAAIDVLFIVLGFAIIVVVSRPGWSYHLRWANPGAAASVLTGIYRMVVDLHHYFRVGTPINAFIASELFLYSGEVVALYSTDMLWRTLRDLARHPTSPEPLAERMTALGVWPPPPVMKP